MSAKDFSWELSERLQQIIEVNVLPGGCLLSFCDPLYSAARGGYHPVEIAVGANGAIRHITDFCYAGTPPCEELVKCLDFDFDAAEFSNMGMVSGFGPEHELLFRLWMFYFCIYYDMGVFKVTVSPERRF